MLLIGLALAMDAETAWVEGDPVAAASVWADRIDAGEVDGDLYYNLGNALYVQGRTPEALVAWRRAQLLSPRDGDIGANLEHARRQSLDRIDAPAPEAPAADEPKAEKKGRSKKQDEDKGGGVLDAAASPAAEEVAATVGKMLGINKGTTRSLFRAFRKGRR